jgi:hypothetical protein
MYFLGTVYRLIFGIAGVVVGFINVITVAVIMYSQETMRAEEITFSNICVYTFIGGVIIAVVSLPFALGVIGIASGFERLRPETTKRS